MADSCTPQLPWYFVWPSFFWISMRSEDLFSRSHLVMQLHGHWGCDDDQSTRHDCMDYTQSHTYACLFVLRIKWLCHCSVKELPLKTFCCPKLISLLFHHVTFQLTCHHNLASLVDFATRQLCLNTRNWLTELVPQHSLFYNQICHLHRKLKHVLHVHDWDI